MMGLTKKKKEKKDQTVFQSPPSPSFLWKSKNWACDLCFRCFWALCYTISKRIQSTYLMILFLAFIASCKTGDKVYILIETHQFTGKKKLQVQNLLFKRFSLKSKFCTCKIFFFPNQQPKKTKTTKQKSVLFCWYQKLILTSAWCWDITFVADNWHRHWKM